ncbi:thiolase family protein [Cytobacillus firmus]|uniref:thiolase family protein n=1 Tax=Cytobacillus TaxID=2675230 RepID=UPI001C211DD8|nr:thiolase family protein [Cytobacillus oceanisediminis]MBU8731689.1 thiolase family protein [Cytobacillus oceanisediminis]MCM3244973.1 thiolase family protein [Cytobacillus oceanisediminis]MCS0826821.1 thiolase family protein [Cytobacillus firmus]
MNQPYIVESVRTAIGRMGGTIKDVPVDHLAEKVIREVLNRSHRDVQVDEVILGQAKQSADTSNLARLAALRAELPIEVTGYTVHRQCGSGLQAINNADMQIRLGYSDVVVAGGAESMSTAPYYIRNARYGFQAGNAQILDPNTESQPCSQPIEKYGNLTMGLTAENLAEKYAISREEQDEFALRSQELAHAAIESGRFEKEIIPVEYKQKRETKLFSVDEHPRSTNIEKLSKLKAVFKENGTVTAGNASGRNDGASVILMMNEAKVNEYSLRPKAKIIAQAVSGVSPEIMGIGPVTSTFKALKQCGLSMDDIGLIELNEAFAAQALSVIRESGMDMNKVNVNGGAIALGHPIGATGAILMTKLLHEMERRGEKYGLVTLCIGGGQGITTIIENLQV